MKSKISLFESVLGRRILIRSLLYGFLMVITVTTVQLVLEYQRNISQIDSRIKQIHASNADSLSASLWNLDRQQILSQLQGVLQIQDIRSIKIISNDLETISVGEPPQGKKIVREFDLNHNTGSEIINLGKLYISADYRDVYQRLWRNAWLILAGSLVIVTFVIVLMLYIISQFVTHPLIELAAFFKDRKTSMLDQPVSVKRETDKAEKEDEIDVLISAINAMMTELKDTHDNLEQQVKERTHELQIERNLFIAGNVVVFKWANQDGWPVEYVSPNVAEVFGYTADDFLSNKIKYIDIISKANINRVGEEVVEATESHAKHFTHQPYQVTRKDGGAIWLDDYSTILRDENDNVTHYLGYVVDITPRKTAELEIILAKTEAEKANQAKSEFLSSMSHELRTPMNAILGFSQLIEIKASDDKTRQYIHEIIHAGQHLLTLINDILDLSKIESGSLDISLECTSLDKIIQECFKLILPLAEKHQIKIINNISNDTHHLIHVDHTRFKQVLLNLLSNAIKYNQAGGSVTLSCSTDSSQRLRLSVQDTGPGLDPQQQQQLFTPFNRIGAENTKIEGTGIGLVITKRLIEMMNGRIGVESQPGTGSTFWVEVNLSEQDYPEIYEITSDNEEPADLQLNTQTSKTILYIEDNPVNQILVEQIITSYTPHKIIIAPDASIGLVLADTQLPDMILLDINLPGIDGYEALKRLQKNISTQHIPVIAVSANAMKSDLAKGKTVGFKDYLTKPIDIQQLITTVNKWLGKTESNTD